MSNIWKIGLYRKVNGNSEAECIVCNAAGQKALYSMKGHNTKGLIVHLTSKHKETEYYKKFEQLQTERKELKEKGGIDKFVTASTSGISALDKKVINWVCCTLTSFNMLNHPTTKMLLGDSLKEESHYRKHVLPKAHELVKARVIKELQDCGRLSFTTDIWLGPNESFISLTAHGISDKWEKKNYVLSVSPFPGSHTGERISDKVSDLLNAWKIEESDCHLFLRDRGANVVKAFADPNFNFRYDHADCAAHLLNLTVHAALESKENNHISKILSKCRHIVGHFKHSNLAKGRFKDIQLEQELPELMFLQDVSTRWNSTFYMCQRLVEQRASVESYAYQKERNELTLTDSEWDTVIELVEILNPLEELTRLFCGSSISVIYPFYIMVSKKLNELDIKKNETKLVREKLCSEIGRYFGSLIDNNNYLLDIFLDPRFKDRFSDNPESFKRKIIDLLNEKQNVSFVEESVQVAIRSPSPKRKNRELLDEFEDNIAASELENLSKITQPIHDLKKEVNEYTDLPRCSLKDDPLIFWKSHEKKVPVLAKFARQYLAPPGTSVASEELFSTARDLYSYRRMRLGPRKAEMIIFLNRCLPLFNYKY